MKTIYVVYYSRIATEFELIKLFKKESDAKKEVERMKKSDKYNVAYYMKEPLI